MNPSAGTGEDQRAKTGHAHRLTRVSTKGQRLDLQLDALRLANCDKLYSDKASGARDDRPELKRCLEEL